MFENILILVCVLLLVLLVGSITANSRNIKENDQLRAMIKLITGKTVEEIKSELEENESSKDRGD